MGKTALETPLAGRCRRGRGGNVPLQEELVGILLHVDEVGDVDDIGDLAETLDQLGHFSLEEKWC